MQQNTMRGDGNNFLARSLNQQLYRQGRCLRACIRTAILLQRRRSERLDETTAICKKWNIYIFGDSNPCGVEGWVLKKQVLLRKVWCVRVCVRRLQII